jgi:hypothetical protein
MQSSRSLERDVNRWPASGGAWVAHILAGARQAGPVVRIETILAIFSSMPEGVSILDQSGRTLPVVMRIAGWSHIGMIAFKSVHGKRESSPFG